MIDVVYPIGDGSKMDNFELRYSLRSIEANLADLRDVIIVGKKPTWVKNVISIPFTDPYKNNKAANIISKIMRSCIISDISEQFIRMSDDQYILKPMDSSSMIPVYNWDMNKYEKWDNNNRWHSLLKRTRDYLKSKDLDCFNYETHIPMIVDKNFFMEFMLETDFGDGIGYVANSIYYNSTILEHTKIDYSKRAVFMEMDKHFVITNEHEYLCHNDAGFSYDLINYLKNKFPNKSRYEQ